jgi:Methyltransferase domain
MKSLGHFIRYVLGLDTPHSQVTEHELQMLMKYCRNAKVVCEIGCYEGKTSVTLAQNTIRAVYSVDPFLRGRLGISYGECIARLHRKRSGVKNLSFLKGFSVNVAPEFKCAIDFLFIDANHTYDAVKADWDSWVPKVVDGGIIALHDSRIAPNSPVAVGSMEFYSEDIPRFAGVIELDFVDSLSILRVGRVARCLTDAQSGVAKSKVSIGPHTGFL